MKLATDKMTARKEGAIGWITFNNPARYNAVSLSMWKGLYDAIIAFAADDEVRLIALKGAGEKAFISGADISEFEENRSSQETVTAYNEVARRATDALANVNKPTIAMIRGYCVGGGVSVALSCDLRIAAEGSSFAVPAAKLGLGYAFEGVRRLVDVVGPSFAREIFYTARQFSADEAAAMGLVNCVVAVEGLESYVRAYAATIASNAPLTVASIKTLVAQALKDESERDKQLCRDVVERCFASEDYREGRRAFMEKRKPKFTGR
ncbi:enoyl-CoA hydratase [Bradyrhizobium sp. 170]|uniref:enoyl-CoA hydratase n=1 Tax=Bradyrhizobium sp. 170 TaxID=2782641 RepID=UPI00200007AA|nr:enoyl-CoA hydratase [Bradyrhizobium sp. 170]UPK05780.1 enoyl-CoA hydratase/isomerase family protein [Bradyrhizobium sp. 170]